MAAAEGYRLAVLNYNRYKDKVHYVETRFISKLLVNFTLDFLDAGNAATDVGMLGKVWCAYHAVLQLAPLVCGLCWPVTHPYILLISLEIFLLAFIPNIHMRPGLSTC